MDLGIKKTLLHNEAAHRLYSISCYVVYTVLYNQVDWPYKKKKKKTPLMLYSLTVSQSYRLWNHVAYRDKFTGQNKLWQFVNAFEVPVQHPVPSCVARAFLDQTGLFLFFRFVTFISAIYPVSLSLAHPTYTGFFFFSPPIFFIFFETSVNIC